MTHSHTLKSLALAVLIALGICAHVGKAKASELETITVAGGCFWCVEADFERVQGVTGAVSGFMGGTVANPTYKQVTQGDTGHYEAVQITFDPAVVSRDTLYQMFFRSIDPTDAGGQFCDRGDSYRSAIFAASGAQADAAQTAKTDAEVTLGAQIVTPILSATEFYPADAYHQDFYKGTQIIITRFGPKRQASAYKAYRESCGRDARVKELWGDAAPFVGS
ncbi:MAG: peptide-methionine (S)-S-oxide reductase MsrA [Roseobacter sp.]|jgi:peptide-methionine (S)-S-oxide reductase|nr:peptide-methionine (S)-S-oxide reductase MsrA [Roseobacter sp.]